MNFLRWLIWGPLSPVVNKLPFSTALSLGKLIGAISHIVFKGRKNILKVEFDGMFPEKSNKEIDRIVKKTFLLRSMAEIEHLLHNRLNSKSINEIVDVEGLEYLNHSLNKGKGVILATFHFGAHLQIMPALGYREYKVNQVASEWQLEDDGWRKGCKASTYLSNRLFRSRLHHSGNKLPANIIPIGTGRSVRPLFKCLKRNEILVIAVDGRRAGNLAAFPFFQHKAYWFATGTVDLALRTGAPIHPTFVVRQENKNSKLVIEKEILLKRSGNEYEKVTHTTGQVVKVLEDYVKQYPCHYGMEILYEKKRLDSLNVKT